MTDDDVPMWADTRATATAALVTRLPVVGDALAVVVRDVHTRRRAAVLVTAEDIAQGSGGVEALHSRLADNPELEAVLVEALDAATPR
jgi:hypothetical protein